MKEVVLCGVCHVDIKGTERLMKVLEKEKPDCITLEISSDTLDSYLKMISEIKKKRLSLAYSTRRMGYTPFKQSEIIKMNRKTLSEFFSQILYEINVANKYAKRYNIPLLCVEKKEYLDEHHKKANEGVKKGTIYYFSKIPIDFFSLDKFSFSRLIDKLYSSDHPNYRLSGKRKAVMEKRDKYAAEKILSVRSKKIVHICGAAHIFGNYQNLFEILKQKNNLTKRLKLNDADKI